jgi:cation transport ATPase
MADESKEEHKEHHEHAHEKEHHEAHKEEHHEKEHEKKQPPSSEKRDLRDSRIFVAVFTLAGTAMGILSSLLKSGGISSWITGGIGILLLIILAAGMGKAFRRKLKFYSTGIFIYLLIWLVAWIFMYNL